MKSGFRLASLFVLVLAVALGAGTMPSFAQQPAAAPAAAAPAAATPAVSWEVFSGYKRYSGNCQVCHGTDALGGTLTVFELPGGAQVASK